MNKDHIDNTCHICFHRYSLWFNSNKKIKLLCSHLICRKCHDLIIKTNAKSKREVPQPKDTLPRCPFCRQQLAF
jgi:hypothetical protein